MKINNSYVKAFAVTAGLACAMGAIISTSNKDNDKVYPKVVDVTDSNNYMGLTREDKIDNISMILPEHYNAALKEDSLATVALNELKAKAATGAYVSYEDMYNAEYEKYHTGAKVGFLSNLNDAISNVNKTKEGSREREIADSIIDNGIEVFSKMYSEN